MDKDNNKKYYLGNQTAGVGDVYLDNTSDAHMPTLPIGKTATKAPEVSAPTIIDKLLKTEEVLHEVEGIAYALGHAVLGIQDDQELIEPGESIVKLVNSNLAKAEELKTILRTLLREIG
jgi:hypothetical protein